MLSPRAVGRFDSPQAAPAQPELPAFPEKPENLTQKLKGSTPGWPKYLNETEY
jgi:hypothetical protein